MFENLRVKETNRDEIKFKFIEKDGHFILYCNPWQYRELNKLLLLYKKKDNDSEEVLKQKDVSFRSEFDKVFGEGTFDQLPDHMRFEVCVEQKTEENKKLLSQFDELTKG